MDTLQIVMMSVWIVIVVITLLLEFQGPQLETIWFTVGSIVALVLAAFNVHYLIQIGAFVLVSVVLLIATRPLSKRFMQKEMIKTNADSLVGQHAIVTRNISLDHRGEVKINAVYWVAFVTKDIKIEEGSKVIILGIEGNKLLVEPIEGGE